MSTDQNNTSAAQTTSEQNDATPPVLNAFAAAQKELESLQQAATDLHRKEAQLIDREAELNDRSAMLEQRAKEFESTQLSIEQARDELSER